MNTSRAFLLISLLALGACEIVGIPTTAENTKFLKDSNGTKTKTSNPGKKSTSASKSKSSVNGNCRIAAGNYIFVSANNKMSEIEIKDKKISVVLFDDRAPKEPERLNIEPSCRVFVDDISLMQIARRAFEDGTTESDILLEQEGTNLILRARQRIVLHSGIKEATSDLHFTRK